MTFPFANSVPQRKRRQQHASLHRATRNRKPFFETLEERRVLASLPFGATPQDTGEFMLGRIAVTPVLLESTGGLSTEDWSDSHVQDVMNNIQTGLQWWNQLLAKKSSVHTLEWVIDRTYVDNRLSTPFEPINMTSEGYLQWGPRFLQDIGYTQASGANFESSLRAFNHAQREKLGTDWSFTIFVVNSARDTDGSFAPGGNFSRAFAFAGGLFEVIPSKRPDSTYTHETGHIFWARDEYIGGGNYYDRRGYYDAQNTNAFDLNPTPNFVQQASIMSSGGSLSAAYSLVISPEATLAQIGWKDSDNDGIFDVLDVPLKLQGTGRYFPQFGAYSFSGQASVQTLPNRNSSGTQNDITINKVRRIEYRIDAGNWTEILATNDYSVNLNLQIPILPAQVGKTIEIRAVETALGITSNIFSGVISDAPDVTTQVGIQGFLWSDANQNGSWNSNESGIPNGLVTLVDANNNPLNLQSLIDPDAFPTGNLAGYLGPSGNAVRIDTVGNDSQALIGVYPLDNISGPKFFKPYSFWARRYVDSFTGEQLQLRARFDQPQSYVSIEAVAVNDASRVRLDAYDSNGNLIGRAEQSGLLRNQRVTLEVQTGSARIASVIARGFQGSSVMLDHLRYGPKSQTTTASDGSYVLPNLPTGFYRLLIDPKIPGFIHTNSNNGILEVNYSAAPVVQHVDFGGFSPPSPWQNPVIAEDISGDQSVSPLDVLTLINDINTNSARSLQGSPSGQAPFLDPNGDRFISPLDVLMVINFLNRAGNAEGESAAPIEQSNESSQDSQRLPSFAFDLIPNAPTRIVYQSNQWQPRSQGPDRCGCPSCCSALTDQSAAEGESNAVPLHWRIDDAFSTESLESLLKN